MEGFRRALADTLPGRQVRNVDVRDAGVLRNISPRRWRTTSLGVGSMRRAGTASG
ncbi:formamidopyrimidine-DNA glycosylase domain protein [Mycobacterium xenopi 3993]|nr:formamidopyrimidine-DNA glycosylase domain protein [Mycobacterium xenopi 3993]